MFMTMKNDFCPISNDLCQHEHKYDSRVCAECGGDFSFEQDQVEVINNILDRRGVVHVSCYLSKDDVLEVDTSSVEGN